MLHSIANGFIFFRISGGIGYYTEVSHAAGNMAFDKRKQNRKKVNDWF